MFAGIRARIGVTFLGFLLLIIASVIATLWAVGGQETDAQIIYLAGRQRLLADRMAREATILQRHPADTSVQQALQDAADLFGQTQQALLYGGPIRLGSDQTLTLPLPARSEAQRQLQQVDRVWQRLRDAIDTLATDSNGSAEAATINQVQTAARAISAQMDQIVRLYEAAADRRVVQLRQIQMALLVGAVILAVFSLMAADYTTVRPIQKLVAASRRIAAGDLETTVSEPEAAIVGDEITVLGQQFETMRRELQTSYDDLAALNRELEARVEQRTQELSALHEITTDILSRLDVQQVLQSVVDKARDLLAADVCVLCLLDDTGQRLCLSATSSNAGQMQSGASGFPELVLAGGVIGDTLAVQECAASAGHPCGLLDAGLRYAHLAVSLHVGTRVIGSLCVGSSDPDRFPSDSQQLLTKLANAAAVALENARLHERAERLATLEERQRIAADIHDGVSQSLIYLQLKVDRLIDEVECQPEALAELRQIRSVFAATNQQVREVITSLRRETGDAVSIQAILGTQATELRQSSGVSVELDVDRALPLLGPKAAKQVTRIVQEALANVQKHAGADRVRIQAYRANGVANLVIEDNGQGFDLEEALAASGHFGLSLMRARAARLDGRLAVDTEPGQGTHLVLTWPLGTSSEPTYEGSEDGANTHLAG